MNYGRFVLLKRIPLECRAYRYDKWRNDNVVDKFHSKIIIFRNTISAININTIKSNGRF
jgi:hypothetical protein